MKKSAKDKILQMSFLLLEYIHVSKILLWLIFSPFMLL